MKYVTLFLHLFLIGRLWTLICIDTNWQHISIQIRHISGARELHGVATILHSLGRTHRHAAHWQGVFIWALRLFSYVMSINSHNNNPMKYYYLPFLMKKLRSKEVKLTMAFQVLNDGAKIQIRLWLIFTTSSCCSHGVMLFQGATSSYSEGIISSIF